MNFSLLLPGGQLSCSSSGSVIRTGPPFIILLRKLLRSNRLARSRQQEAVVLVVTNPIGPLRRGSRLFCSGSYDEQFAELLVDVKGCIVPLWRPAPHFTSLHSFWRLLGSQWNSSQTQGSGPKLSWAGSGSKNAPLFILLQHHWPQSTTVSSSLFRFVLNQEDGGVERAEPPAEPEAAQQS